MRDVQRARVDRAERACAEFFVLPGPRPAENSQAFIDRVTLSCWWRNRWPEAAAAGIVFHARRRRTNQECVKKPVRTQNEMFVVVAMAPETANHLRILHQLAHVAVQHRAHDHRFARAYLELVKRWLGYDAWRALRAGYRSERIKFRRKPVITPERMVALQAMARKNLRPKQKQKT